MSVQSLSRMKNDPNYSAPEVLNNNGQVKESDVYSFAMILFEMITKEKPFNKLKNPSQIFNEVVNKGKRTEFPAKKEERISQCYKELIEKCWSQNPSDRPSFDEIFDILKNDKRFLTENVDKDEYFGYIKSIINSSEPLKAEAKPKIVEIEEIEENKPSQDESNKSENRHSVNNDEQVANQKVDPKDEFEKDHQKIEETNLISNSNDDSPVDQKLIQDDSSIQKVEENNYSIIESNKSENHHSVNNDEKVAKQKIDPKDEFEKDHQKIEETNLISNSNDDSPVDQKLIQNNSSIQKVKGPSPISEKPSHHKSSVKTDQSTPKPFSQQPPKPLPPKFSSSSNGSTEFHEIFNEIRDDSNDTNWVLFGFDGTNKKWTLSGKGAGGLDQIKTEIGPDFIGYGFIRVPTKRSTIKRDVFIKFKYLSKSAKMMAKAMMNARRGEIDEVINYYHFSIEVSSNDELSDEISNCISKK